jgi:hypothetical protein
VTNRLGIHLIGTLRRDLRSSVYVAVVPAPEAPLSRTGVWITRLILLVLVAAVVLAAITFLR